MDLLALSIALVLGLTAGATVVYLAVKGRIAEGEGLRTDLAARQAELAALETRHETAVVEIESLKGTVNELKEELEETQADRHRLDKELSVHLNQLSERERHNEERLKFLQETEAQLKNSFNTLSQEALKKSATDFVRQAEEVLKRYKDQGDTDAVNRKRDIEHILAPMREKLEALDKQNQELEKSRVGAYSDVVAQIKALNEHQVGLQKETIRLTKALQDPGSAGQWGEMILDKVVEMAGLDKYVMVQTQTTTYEDGIRQRPDMVISLPGDRTIIIDSKTPMKAYLDALDLGGDHRDMLLNDHAKKLYEHAKTLGKRDYARSELASDFVIMFVPSESAFRTAIEYRPSLLEECLAHNVVLATPMTLLPLLRGVGYSWRQERLGTEAREVQKLGRELYDRTATMVEHFNKLGNSINSCATNYNRLRGSLEDRVLVSLRRFKEIGVETSKEMESTSPVETWVTDLRVLPGMEDLA